MFCEGVIRAEVSLLVNFRNFMMSDKAELEGGKRIAEDEAAGGSDRETRKKTKVSINILMVKYRTF